MSQATESPVLSKLLTQGRHCNASVKLLLQNMFHKGKFNTDISRNPQYMVLFRSPSDRKQIDIMAERIFAKDRPNFMFEYGSVTAKPYGYVLIDNQPKTTSENQVVSEVLGHCQSYPNISQHTNSEVTQSTPEPQPIEPTEVKHQKSKVELAKPPAKKLRKQLKQAKKRSKAKPNAKKPHNVKKQPKRTTKPTAKAKVTKPHLYKPRVIIPQPRESSDEDPFNFEEDYSENESLNYENESTANFQDELIKIARQHKALCWYLVLVCLYLIKITPPWTQSAQMFQWVLAKVLQSHFANVHEL